MDTPIGDPRLGGSRKLQARRHFWRPKVQKRKSAKGLHLCEQHMLTWKHTCSTISLAGPRGTVEAPGSPWMPRPSSIWPAPNLVTPPPSLSQLDHGPWRFSCSDPQVLAYFTTATMIIAPRSSAVTALLRVSLPPPKEWVYHNRYSI